jgi:peptidoglycan/xylan/chitin deacetylase (PgdA/CDA1 family)
MSKLRVLMYHKVSLNHSDFLTVTQKQLERQLMFLETKYQFIQLSDLEAHLFDSKPLPKNSLLITFDDGYMNNYELAYPIFKKSNIPFSIFLVANYFGKSIEHDGHVQNFLGLKECKEMQELTQFAYHSIHHENIMELPENEWEKHIQICKDFFEKQGLKMQNFWAYTYGAYPKKNMNQLKHLISCFQKSQILGAFRIGNRINALPLKKPFEIERIDVRGDENFLKFQLKTSIGKPF